MTFISTIGFSSVTLAQKHHQSKALHKNKVKRKGHSVKAVNKIQNQQQNNQSVNASNLPKAGIATGAAVATIPSASGMPSSVEPDKGTVTGLPLPHFLSMRADEVNMRAGPGTRYPILWIYHRRNMPVKVLREFDVWRLVEDVDGQKGWIQQAILSRKRSFIITGLPLSVATDTAEQDDSKTKPEIKHTNSYITGYVADNQSLQSLGQAVILRDAAQETANPVAILKPGVIGDIKECPVNINWCKVKVVSYTGWIPRASFWGLLSQEVIQPH